MKTVKAKKSPAIAAPGYSGLVGGIGELLESARRASVRAVNSVMTATYWEIGRRIVVFEQGGAKRAGYGEGLLERLSQDLTAKHGRGFARPNLVRFRQFYQAFPRPGIRSTLSNESPGAPVAPTRSAQSDIGEICQTPSGGFAQSPLALSDLARAFPLPWSHYVLLLGRARSPEAFAFYHTEALRGGWSVRQLRRQIDTQFYERVALSRNKAALLAKGAEPQPGDAVASDEEIRDPLVLEFLNLKDEYSEADLEEALIRHLESFLLELGGDFTFVGRQRRLRIGDEWYRVDLLFFHRVLRCLVVIDLKLGRFSHADAGQMHVYLNYAREHWMRPGENPPVGLILCTSADAALARYALDGLPGKVLAREYRLALPEEKLLVAELEKTRAALERRRA